MKTLLIEICGSQNFLEPRLDISLSFNDQLFLFDQSKNCNKFEIQYNNTEIVTHNLSINVDKKRWYIDNSKTDVSMLSYIINSIRVDNIDVVPILQTSAVYLHRENGYADNEIVAPYTDYLGYDGALAFKLLTPLFCWWMLDFEF